jgi:hypothetical protein
MDVVGVGGDPHRARFEVHVDDVLYRGDPVAALPPPDHRSHDQGPLPGI